MAETSTAAPSRLWVFSALSACLAMGYGVLFTIVGDYRDEYGISETEIGIIIGAGFLSAFVAQVFVAPIADRGRARQMVLAGTAVNVAGLLLMGFGTAFWPIMIGRIISGIGIGAANPAIRRIVVLADPTNLGRNLGRLLSADVFGFALGPAVSAVLVGPLGIPAPFIVVAAASALFVLPTLGLHVRETVEDTGKRLALDLLRIRPVAGAVVLGSGAFLMIGAFDALWDVVHEDLGTTEWLANIGITLFAVPLIVLGPTAGRLAQEWGPFRLASAGLLVAAVFMTSYGLLPSGGWIFTVAMAHALTDGLTFAAAGVGVSLGVPDERQAGAQGVLGAAQALAAGLTAPFIGLLYEHQGRAAAYIAGAIGMVAMVAIGLALAAPAVRRGGRVAAVAA